MSVPFPSILAQVDLVGSVVGVVVSIAVSFAVITLIASYYRFQHIVEQAEKKNPEEMGTSANEVLRVQLARYLAGCGRRGASFSLALIHPAAPGFRIQMDSQLVAAVKHAARRDDVVCLYNDDTIALLAESEPEDAESMMTRITAWVAGHVGGVQLAGMHAGIASYPGHGLSGRELIDVALQGLEQAGPERPVVLPEIVDVDAEEEEPAAEEPIDEETHKPADSVEHDEEAESKGWRVRRKEAILDPVTGVLKPSVISAYMQRMMSDLRYKKQKAALFCIGVNNLDHIARFHGEEAADAVLAGVSKILQEHLRADDLIGRHEKYAFLVLSKCSLEEAEGMGRRISTLVQHAQFEIGNKKLKTTITLGVATYPEHGRNLHHLYTASQKVLDHSRTNDIRAYAVYDPEIHDKVPSKPMKSIKSVKA
jgi:diguanylate cyclase (GGDEF)-like protein